jgi:hypothetical protein
MSRKTVREFLDDHPEAVAYSKRIGQAITEKKISLKGDPYTVAQRAYEFTRRGIEGSIERFFEEEDQRAAEKWERRLKAELRTKKEMN